MLCFGVCLVIVRPDQFVAHVLPLDGTAQLAAFFDGFMVQADSASTNTAPTRAA